MIEDKQREYRERVLAEIERNKEIQKEKAKKRYNDPGLTIEKLITVR